MAATLTAVSAATESTPVRRGFQLACLNCGERGGIHINLGDTGTFHCRECDAELDLTEVELRLAEWTAALAWVKSAPVLLEE